MDVVILCGGMGTRLREETRLRPKPMVEIGDKPILWHIMKHYSHYGFCRFILALGYKSGYIKRFFYKYRKDPWEIVCVDTGISNLKGSRIKQLEPYIKGEDFHLTYGDGISNVNLNSIKRFHLMHKNIGTVTAVHPPSRFGEITVEGRSVKKFIEKPQLATGIINGGFFVFKRNFLNYLTPDATCDFEFGALQRLSSEGQLMAYRHEGFWQCMDTMRDRDYLNELWTKGNAPWKIW